VILFLIGLRLSFAVKCFQQGVKGFDHLRSVYLKNGQEIALGKALEQLRAEGIISIYNVHVRNVVFDLCEASKTPKISWRQKEHHG
jgi:hypothetical protein